MDVSINKGEVEWRGRVLKYASIMHSSLEIVLRRWSVWDRRCFCKAHPSLAIFEFLNTIVVYYLFVFINKQLHTDFVKFRRKASNRKSSGSISAFSSSSWWYKFVGADNSLGILHVDQRGNRFWVNKFAYTTRLVANVGQGHWWKLDTFSAWIPRDGPRTDRP